MLLSCDVGMRFALFLLVLFCLFVFLPIQSFFIEPMNNKERCHSELLHYLKVAKFLEKGSFMYNLVPRKTKTTTNKQTTKQNNNNTKQNTKTNLQKFTPTTFLNGKRWHLHEEHHCVSLVIAILISHYYYCT